MYHVLRVPLPAPHAEEPQGQEEHRQTAAKLHDPQDGDRVAAPRRVVMITEEQELVPGAAELAVGGLDEGQAEIARAVDAVEDAREPAVGREDEEAGGVGELLGLVVPAVAE